MVAAGEAGRARSADRLAARDGLPFLHRDRRHVAGETHQAAAVVDQHRVAVDPEPAGVDDLAGVRRRDLGVGEAGEVEAEMGLGVHGASLVDVAARLGEAGAARGVLELQERPLPEHRRRGAAGELDDLGEDLLAQLAVDPDVLVDQRAVGLHPRRVGGDRRDDLLEEGVVDLDRVAPRRRRLELREERLLDAVPGLVLGEDLDPRGIGEFPRRGVEDEPPLRIAAGHGERERLDVAGDDAGASLRRARLDQHHPSAALAQVVLRREDRELRRAQMHRHLPLDDDRGLGAEEPRHPVGGGADRDLPFLQPGDVGRPDRRLEVRLGRRRPAGQGVGAAPRELLLAERHDALTRDQFQLDVSETAPRLREAGDDLRRAADRRTVHVDRDRRRRTLAQRAEEAVDRGERGDGGQKPDEAGDPAGTIEGVVGHERALRPAAPRGRPFGGAASF